MLFSVLPREVIRPDVIEEVIVSCVIKHLGLIDSLQSLVNLQYREEHREEYEMLCKIMAEAFKKINAMERQLQVCMGCLHICGNWLELGCFGSFVFTPDLKAQLMPWTPKTWMKPLGQFLCQTHLYFRVYYWIRLNRMWKKFSNSGKHFCHGTIFACFVFF